MDLVVLPISPWSERTLFGLHVAQLHGRIRVIEYKPFISEPYLRWRMGRLLRWNDKVTVPVLFLPSVGEYVEGSLNILRVLAKESNGLLAMPQEEEGLVERINRLVDVALNNGRYRFTAQTSRAGGGKLDADKLPFPMNWLLPRLPAAAEAWMSKLFSSKLLLKYHATEAAAEDQDAALRDAFDKMKAALLELQSLIQTASGDLKQYITDDRLTVADVLLSSAIPFIPLPQEYNNLGANMLEGMRDPDLEPLLQPLREWRDALYRKHRK